MKIKLNRGPMKNKRVITPNDYYDRYNVMEPVYDKMAFIDPAITHLAWEPIKERRGHYQKSNVMLKDGTWVFEWMGWQQ
jgi:hypothetical protein